MHQDNNKLRAVKECLQEAVKEKKDEFFVAKALEKLVELTGGVATLPRSRSLTGESFPYPSPFFHHSPPSPDPTSPPHLTPHIAR